MVEFDEDAIDKILFTYREWLRTNKLKLDPELRKVMLKNITLTKFRIHSYTTGILQYSNWVIPIAVNYVPAISSRLYGEGYDTWEYNTVATFRVRALGYALAEIWMGNLTDLMCLYASIIEIANQLKCGLPPAATEDMGGGTYERAIHLLARELVDEKRKESS